MVASRSKFPTVLVVADDDDVHADWMVVHLQGRGARCLRLHPGRLFAEGGYALGETGAGTTERWFSTPAGRVDLAEVTAVYHRRPDPPSPAAMWGLEPAVEAFWVREHAAVVDALLAAVPAEVRWVNHPVALRRARNKLLQLREAAATGLRIPDTLVTNQPELAHRFFVDHGRSIITKTLTLGRVDYGSDATFLFTQVVPCESTREDFQVIERGSSLLQERIEVAYEVRASIVGDRVFSLRIDAADEAVDAPVVVPARGPDRAAWELRDWRAESPDRLRYRPVDLPGSVSSALVDLQRRLGLCSGQADLIVTPEGEHVFLETNPDGQWLWAEIEGSLPIGSSFGDLLLGELAWPVAGSLA